ARVMVRQLACAVQEKSLVKKEMVNIFFLTQCLLMGDPHRIRLLADAIPARTLAAGKREVLRLGPINEFNFDMQTTYKTTKKVNGKYVIFWPSSRGKNENWWHGDAREVAYSYVYSLFDKFVEFGGLK
ncbi:MAG: hypothetical protein WAV13_07550, partial [Thermodesulfovibrionales bacterium]